jgi:hypothetical protein
MQHNYDVTGLRRLGYVHALASFDASINNDPDTFADIHTRPSVTSTVFRGHLMPPKGSAMQAVVRNAGARSNT